MNNIISKSQAVESFPYPWPTPGGVVSMIGESRGFRERFATDFSTGPVMSDRSQSRRGWVSIHNGVCGALYYICIHVLYTGQTSRYLSILSLLMYTCIL